MGAFLYEDEMHMHLLREVELKNNSAKLQSEDYVTCCGGIWLLRFVDDLAGAVYDFLKFILSSIGYLLAGMIIVAVPMYVIAWIFGLFH